MNQSTTPKLCNYHGAFLTTWDGPGNFDKVTTKECQHCEENRVLVLKKLGDEGNPKK